MEMIIKKYNGFTDNEIIEDFNKIKNQLNKETITFKEYHENGGKYGMKAIRLHFKSYTEFLKQLGLPLNYIGKPISKYEILDIVIDLWNKKGSQPTLQDFCNTNHTKKIIISNFGTWMNCLNEAILYAKSHNKQIYTIYKHTTSREISKGLKYDIMKRDNFKCVICGRTPANVPGLTLDVDHIKAWTNGGETIPENLRTLCSDCNSGKSSKE